jgi:hypothetical protein
MVDAMVFFGLQGVIPPGSWEVWTGPYQGFSNVENPAILDHFLEFPHGFSTS